MRDSTTISLLELTFDFSKPELKLRSDCYVLLAIFFLIIGIILLLRYLRSRKFPIVEMEVVISGSPSAKFKATRDDSNIYIANRIYIELITRKAALPFDEQNDVIKEIYDSWSKLFNIIRDEIKTVPGHYLRSHNSINALIGLSTRILNDGLRPHLTKYQAKFRKWYEHEESVADFSKETPQDIQAKYSEYKELVEDMKRVNHVLIDYSMELEKLIKGKKA